MRIPETFEEEDIFSYPTHNAFERSQSCVPFVFTKPREAKEISAFGFIFPFGGREGAGTKLVREIIQYKVQLRQCSCFRHC